MDSQAPKEQTREQAQALKLEILSRFSLFLKGMAMGAADSVPGISGGTIAFISGIYEELINSIQKVNLKALQILFKQGPIAAWGFINGTFLLTLALGILTSVMVLANSIEYLLTNYPQFVMSFFVGLILASCWFLQAEIQMWNFRRACLLVAGLLLSLGLTFITPLNTDAPSLPYIFISASIAICAMILPGISGAFILILLGTYSVVLKAVTEFDVLILSVFLSGCICGLLAFSNLLNFLFKHHRVSLVTFLLGILIGSLYTLWPLRVETPVYTNENIDLFIFILLAVAGFLLVYGFEYLSRPKV